MKKFLFTLIVGIVIVTTVNAQVVAPVVPAAPATVVVKTPGLVESLINAATAVVTAPVVFGSAIIGGVEEVIHPAVCGQTLVTTVPGYGTPIVSVPPVVPAAPVAPVVPVAPVTPVAPVVPAPVVATPAVPTYVAPTIVDPGCYRYPYGATTTITTSTVSPFGGVVVQSYTRPISAYEIGVPVAPVPIEHRVGVSPLVNPYVFRYR